MEDEPQPEPVAAPASQAEGQPARRGATEVRLRRIAKRKGDYGGEIVAISRAWVSRDSKLHAFAARFLDFAMLTPEHLLLCSTGFFTRRPRHQVLLEPLNRIVVVPVGPDPVHTVRIHGDFNRALLLQLRTEPDALAFVRELLARTRRDPNAPTPEATPTEPGSSWPV
jgi:hypothetical protein